MPVLSFHSFPCGGKRSSSGGGFLPKFRFIQEEEWPSVRTSPSASCPEFLFTLDNKREKDESTNLDVTWDAALIDDFSARLDAFVQFVLIIVGVGFLICFRQSRIYRTVDTLSHPLAEG